MVEPGRVEALFALRREGRSLVGRDRIELLEAVDAHGSISKAARVMGMSYKAAWDALNVVNNLLPHPAIQAQVGGRQGGGARVTEEGYALIAGFRLLEERLGRVAAVLAGDGGGTFDPFALLWGIGMKTSVRNAFRCTVSEVKTGGVSAEVVMPLSSTSNLVAVITAESLRDLGIVPGSQVMALIKSSFVMLADADYGDRVSARNRVSGTIMHREDGLVNSEFTLDVGDGKSLTAVVTRDAADAMGLTVGNRAVALFKASHVILAVG